MIGRLNHVAIAVRDIAKAAEVYRKTLGADVSAAVPQPAHGVTTVFTPASAHARAFFLANAFSSLRYPHW